MSVKDDLIAARALIDAPEKLQHYQRMVDLIRAVSGDETVEDDARFIAMVQAISKANDAATPRGILLKRHAEVMAIFDRAIEAQP